MLFVKTFIVDVKVHLKIDLDSQDDQWVLDQQAKIRAMEEDLARRSMLDDVPPDRKDYIHLILGCEPTLDLTFDPSRVPLPNDFVKKMDEYYQKQVRKGVVNVKKEAVKQRLSFTTAQVLPKMKEKKYSWIPVSEIHTARTKIDSFVHLKADERRKLHEKFARFVSSLISQFEHIGTLDDDSITPEQSAHLTASFSEALVEIQNHLFQPITRQHVLAKRGPLFKQKTTFEGRRLKYRNKQTLSDISGNVRKKTNHLETTKNSSQDLLMPEGIEEQMDAFLPPAYRPSEIPNPPKLNPSSFLEMTAKIKAEMERVDEEHKKRPKPVQEVAKPKRKIDILVTPRRPVPTPSSRKKKIVRKKRDDISFEHVEQPENAFFDKGMYDLEPISGVETGSCLEGIEKLFSPMVVHHEEVHKEVKQSVDPLPLPEFEKKKHEVEETKYIFKPDLEKVAELRDVDELFEIDENGTTEEHQSLLHLWDELGLHPDTRLLMAARLCAIVTEDYSSDYHFQAILGATKDFKTYNMCYKKYKDALNYEPGISSEEKAAYLADLSRDFKVAEDAFKLANQEMVHVLGAEIHTNKGPIATIIETRAEKIRNLRLRCGIGKVARRRSEVGQINL